MSRLTQEKIGRSVNQSIVGHCTFKCMHEIITHVDLAGHLMTLWQPLSNPRGTVPNKSNPI